MIRDGITMTTPQRRKLRNESIPHNFIQSWQCPTADGVRPVVRRPITVCESSRTAKVKCTGNQSTCDRCTSRGTPCRYTAPSSMSDVPCARWRANLYVGVMTLIAMTTSQPEHPLYVGRTGLTWGIGIVLGPALEKDSVSLSWAGAGPSTSTCLLAPSVLRSISFCCRARILNPGVALKERSREVDVVGTAQAAAACASKASEGSSGIRRSKKEKTR